jgi:hypothetical protein
MSTIETLAEPSKPKEKKRLRGSAMENLVKASADEVRAHCTEIAEALVKRVVAGDVNSARASPRAHRQTPQAETQTPKRQRAAG